MDQHIYYSIGFRDALASICAQARLTNAEDAIQKTADELLKYDPDQCHAKWIKEHKCDSRRN
ncbi:MAG: hypothetical protein M0R80_01275 [Proteobacteria bacterium]|nr:hypothetical protein [Pseudomonadota bacterium]